VRASHGKLLIRPIRYAIPCRREQHSH
jgi:hypothetical protein